jgi:hypothetical protein
MVVREHYQTGYVDHDVVGDYFKEVHTKMNQPDQCHIEVQDFENTDTRLSIMWYQNKVKAFVIETRNDFNNIDFIKGEVD